MNKYKVQITKTYVIDVLASNQEDAITQAENELEEQESANTQHYSESQDPEIVVFDVTHTEDPFSPA